MWIELIGWPCLLESVKGRGGRRKELHLPPHPHMQSPHTIQLIIARDIAKAPELTSLLKQCAKTVLGAGEGACV